MAIRQAMAVMAKNAGGLAVAPEQSSAAAAPASEPTLEMRTIAYVASQTAAPASAASGASASATPRPVATPLPPRKRSQTGKQCPTTAATPQAAPSDLESADFAAKKAGKNPFRASSTSVASAAVRPAARATFV